MGAAYSYDYELDDVQGGVKFSNLSVSDFALDFEDVVPLFYTNVLLVEDDPATTSFIKSTIKKHADRPVQVRSFTSAEKAGEYIMSLKKHHLPGPDLAIVDYLLAGAIDGLWVCKLLENRFPETHTILTSSTPTDQMSKKMEALHLNPYFIQKPFEASNLLGLLMN